MEELACFCVFTEIEVLLIYLVEKRMKQNYRFKTLIYTLCCTVTEASVQVLICRLLNPNVLEQLLGSALQLKTKRYVSAACNALTMFSGFPSIVKMTCSFLRTQKDMHSVEDFPQRCIQSEFMVF